MKKFIAVLSFAALAMAALALPAAAANDVDAGVLSGQARVGKASVCAEADDQGIGLPVLNGVKTGTWALDTTQPGLLGVAPGAVVSATQGLGDLNACGALGAVAGIGAACGMSHGHSGSGDVDMDNGEHVALSNVGWAATAGGTLPVAGRATPDGKSDVQLLAVVQAQGGAGCISKDGDDASKTGGATVFQVAGAYTMGGPVLVEYTS